MTKIQINLKSGDTLSRTTYSQLDKVELQEELAADNVAADFKNATVTYDEDHSHSFDSYDELIAELGKYGG